MNSIEILPAVDSVALQFAKDAWSKLDQDERMKFHAWSKSILFADKYQKQQIPASLRWRIFNRDEMRCVYCGSGHDLTIDHLIPESIGGGLDECNLATACRSCNSEKGVSPFLPFMLERMIESLKLVKSAVLNKSTDAEFFMRQGNFILGASRVLSNFATTMKG